MEPISRPSFSRMLDGWFRHGPSESWRISCNEDDHWSVWRSWQWSPSLIDLHTFIIARDERLDVLGRFPCVVHIIISCPLDLMLTRTFWNVGMLRHIMRPALPKNAWPPLYPPSWWASRWQKCCPLRGKQSIKLFGSFVLKVNFVGNFKTFANSGGCVPVSSLTVSRVSSDAKWQGESSSWIISSRPLH